MNTAIMSNKVAAPTSHFVHALEVAAGSRLLYITGQIPLNTDGTTPESFSDQCELVWRNIRNILEAADMTLKDLVKIQGFVVRPSDMHTYRRVREQVLGDHLPASTMICIAALGRPEWLVEIEAVAAKA
jgi:2-iminobutanoate/2-iminopropanoate deaminase